MIAKAKAAALEAAHWNVALVQACQKRQGLTVRFARSLVKNRKAITQPKRARIERSDRGPHGSNGMGAWGTHALHSLPRLPGCSASSFPVIGLNL